MKKFLNFALQYKHFLILLVFIPTQLWFGYLEAHLVPRYITDTPLDNHIPFVKAFVIPYVLWFFYIGFGVVYTGFRSKREFYKLVIFLAGSMVVACTIFTLYPNAQNLRPVITQNDPLSQLIRYIYSTDTPTDVCPSMHVINAIAVYSALRNTEGFSSRRIGKSLSFVLMVLMCLSTVFIKQHAVLDLFVAVAISAAFYVPLYVLPRLRVYREVREVNELREG